MKPRDRGTVSYRDFSFILSERLVAHLDIRNPRLTYKDPPLFLQAPEPQVASEDKEQQDPAPDSRWKSCVVLRTRATCHPSNLDDSACLWMLLPGFARDMTAHAKLLFRLWCMKNQTYALQACLESIRSRFQNPKQPFARAANLRNWGIWSLHPLKLPPSCLSKDEKAKATGSRVARGDDSDSDPCALTTRQCLLINRVWSPVFHYTNVQGQDGSVCTLSTSSADTSDELCPLWYLVLSEMGYTTGLPLPGNCPSLCDKASLPLRLFDPKTLQIFADHAEKQATLANDRLLSPAEFLGIIDRMATLAKAKETAMHAYLQKLSPSLAVLLNSGFQTELIDMALILHRGATTNTPPSARRIRF